METLIAVLIIEIQQDEGATPSGTGAPTTPLPATRSLCPSSCPPPLLLLGIHHRHPLEDSKGSVTHSHPALLPSPDLLDGRHHLFDVIFGPAPGLGPHGPAGHAGGARAGTEPVVGRPAVRRSQAARQAPAPLFRPAVPPGVGRALPRSPTPPRVPAWLPETAPRPGPSPERPGRRGRLEPRPGSPASSAPARARPSGRTDAQRPLPAAERESWGAAVRLDARGPSEAVRSGHVGTGVDRKSVV